MYAVILAGGGGTRLWPLSRPERPKPFLPLLGSQSLLQRTVARIAPLVTPDRVHVVTDRRYLPIVFEQLPDVPRANVVGEPVGRNTAAAVALATEGIDCNLDDVMLVLPADAHILDEEGFRGALVAAEAVAGTGALVTLGVTPTGPETGYGYVIGRPPAREVAGHTTFVVERFVEKPSVERAEEMIDSGVASWNAGIFLWRRQTIRERLDRHAPDIIEPVRAALGGRTIEAAAADLDAVYPTIRSTSIDYAVMEPASLEGAVSVVPIDVGWSDLGSWSALRDAWLTTAAAAGSVGAGPRHDVGSEGTLVLAHDRLVVTIGLRDTIVVDTPDALLVVAADRSQDVRRVAEEFAAGKLPGPGSGEESSKQTARAMNPPTGTEEKA